MSDTVFNPGTIKPCEFCGEEGVTCFGRVFCLRCLTKALDLLKQADASERGPCCTPKSVDEIKEMALKFPIVNITHRGVPARGSKLVWWLAMLAGRAQIYRRPEVGEWVVENTHLFGTARHRIGMLFAVGKIIKIEDDPDGGQAITLLTIEGKEQRWMNANFCCLEEKARIE